MTPEAQQHILQRMQAHLTANMGNRITDALCHGLLAVLTIITSERMLPTEPPKE